MVKSELSRRGGKRGVKHGKIADGLLLIAGIMFIAGVILAAMDLLIILLV